MVTARLPSLLRATALATTTLLGETRLVKNRLDLARRIIQHTLNLVHLSGIKRGRHLLNATRKLLSTAGLATTTTLLHLLHVVMNPAFLVAFAIVSLDIPESTIAISMIESTKCLDLLFGFLHTRIDTYNDCSICPRTLCVITGEDKDHY